MDSTAPQVVHQGRERLSTCARTKRKRDAIQQVARREAASITVDMDAAEEDIEDEEPPPLMDDDEEEWYEDDDDDLTRHTTTLDDQVARFLALVESLLPRHGHFYETRGPTLGADRQRRIEALARAAMITGSNMYGVLHAKEWGNE
jgi:hypothetical protein